MDENNEVKKIPCEQCAKHIPESAATTFEGSDYTHHFCCTECMNLWKEKNEENK